MLLQLGSQLCEVSSPHLIRPGSQAHLDAQDTGRVQNLRPLDWASQEPQPRQAPKSLARESALPPPKSGHSSRPIQRREGSQGRGTGKEPRRTFEKGGGKRSHKDATGARPAADGAESPKVEPQPRPCPSVPSCAPGGGHCFAVASVKTRRGLSATPGSGAQEGAKDHGDSSRRSQLPVMWKKQMRPYFCAGFLFFLSHGGTPKPQCRCTAV